MVRRRGHRAATLRRRVAVSAANPTMAITGAGSIQPMVNSRLA